MQRLVWMTGLFHSVYWCKMLLRCKSLWRERFGCCIYSLHFFDSASKEIILCTPTVASSPPYWPWQQQRSFTIPSVTKLPHSHSVLSLINQPSNVGIFLWPSEREFIIQLLTKSGTPRAVLATAGEVRHISVDLLAWYTGHSKIKYVPQDISHLS